MESDKEIEIKKLKEQLEQKNAQIKNLQNKLDSQDIIIEDYYKLRENSTKNKLSLQESEKKYKSINAELISLKDILSKNQIENQKLKKENIILISQLQDLKNKLNNLLLIQNKNNFDEKKLLNQELIIKNIKKENEILLEKVRNLSEIEEKSEKVINDLKDINYRLNTEKENLCQEKKALEENIKYEIDKNKKLLENNKQLIEEKNNLKKEKINIELALKNNKKKYRINKISKFKSNRRIKSK